jgi:CRP/FNR family transcriptional regulator, cyclic AMP receptor protein
MQICGVEVAWIGRIEMRADPTRRSQRSSAKRQPTVDVMRPSIWLVDEAPEGHKSPQINSEAGFGPEVFLTKAGLGRNVVTLRKGELVYAQGDLADAIFYVRRGRLRITVTSKKGKEATISLVGAGEFLGEDSIASGRVVRLSAATAMTGCTLIRIGKAQMVSALGQEHSLSEIFVAFLLARNARVQADLVDQLFNSSEKRLARTLLMLAQFGKESAPEKAIPKISQEVLAEMVGTTRSRVSFFMNRFRKLGFVDYDGEIRIHSSLLNVFLHE